MIGQLGIAHTTHISHAQITNWSVLQRFMCLLWDENVLCTFDSLKWKKNGKLFMKWWSGEWLCFAAVSIVMYTVMHVLGFCFLLWFFVFLNPCNCNGRRRLLWKCCFWLNVYEYRCFCWETCLWTCCCDFLSMTYKYVSSIIYDDSSGSSTSMTLILSAPLVLLLHRINGKIVLLSYRWRNGWPYNYITIENYWLLPTQSVSISVHVTWYNQNTHKAMIVWFSHVVRCCDLTQYLMNVIIIWMNLRRKTAQTMTRSLTKRKFGVNSRGQKHKVTGTLRYEWNWPQWNFDFDAESRGSLGHDDSRSWTMADHSVPFETGS